MEIFVTFEIAKKLKEKGFNEECLCHYIGNDLVYNIESPIANNQLWFSHNKFDNIWHRDNYDAPTISQVLQWFRKEHHLHFEIVSAAFGYDLIISDTPDKGGTYRYLAYVNDDGSNNAGAWDKYEDCILYGIEYALNNLI
jgi:hypothetical protein